MATILHTSDWHVGKTIRGHSRADEHRAVLTEIATLAADRSVDLVVVAGDLFETAAPSPEAEEIVYRALLDLVASGAAVVVVSGNHDNAHRLRAVAPLLEIGNVHLATQPAAPDRGGVRRITLASGENIDVGLLPFVSQRGIVRAEQLMANAAFENAQAYADRLRVLIGLLSAAFVADVASLLVVHGFVLGGAIGGGERQAHLVDEYAISSQAFPATVGYAALGHLHRAQKIPGATAIHYCGSPLQLDFGETTDPKQVNLVDIQPGRPAKVTPVELTSGSRLVTLSGSLEQVVASATNLDPTCWIRVRLDEPRRPASVQPVFPGLADELRHRLGDIAVRLVDVTVNTSTTGPERPAATRRGRPPRELFGEFLATRNVDDPRLLARFDELHAATVEDDGSVA